MRCWLAQRFATAQTGALFLVCKGYPIVISTHWFLLDLLKATCVTDVSIVHPNVFFRWKVSVTPRRAYSYVSAHSVVPFARTQTEMPLSPTSNIAITAGIETR